MMNDPSESFSMRVVGQHSQDVSGRVESAVGRDGVVQKSPDVFLDVTDFVQYAEAGNVTVSGIQRVIANLVIHRGVSEFSVLPVVLERDARILQVADVALVMQLIDLLQADHIDRSAIIGIAREVRLTAITATPQRGDVFVMAGAFWIYKNYDLFLAYRSEGVKIAIFVHDLIQINNPEYVSLDANEKFRKALLDVLAVTSLILTNSYYVRDDVRKFTQNRLGLDLAVEAVQLPTELPSIAISEDLIPPELKALAGCEYVLCVTTIEVRKNHLALIDIWERLYAIPGLRVPDLVFVGKWGWQVTELKARIAQSGALGKWLHILNDLSDAGLGYLYKHALFTVYPSFAEGWGLPVGESLQYGKACVASRATSIPEVGGDLVDYFDPHDVDEGYFVIKELLERRDLLAKREARIKAEFRPKTWSEYCREFYVAINRHVAGEPLQGNGCNYGFKPGILYVIGDDDLAWLDSCNGSLISARMTRDGHWHGIENWGAWTSAESASFKLQTDLNEGTEVAIALVLRAHQSQSTQPCVTVECDGLSTSIGRLVSTPTLATARGRVGVAGELIVKLRSQGAAHEIGEGLQLYVGACGIGFYEPMDLASKLGIHEAYAQLASRAQSAEATKGLLNDLVVDEMYASGFFMARLLGGGLRRDSTEFPWLTRQRNALELSFARRAARRHDWARAEHWYARVLRRGWMSAGIWTQYGHALKEQRDYGSALSAYLVARTLMREPGELSRHIEFCKAMRRETDRGGV